MLGNIRLGVKSKTKNLIIPLYKSVVHHIWNTAYAGLVSLLQKKCYAN